FLKTPLRNARQYFPDDLGDKRAPGSADHRDPPCRRRLDSTGRLDLTHRHRGCRLWLGLHARGFIRIALRRVAALRHNRRRWRGFGGSRKLLRNLTGELARGIFGRESLEETNTRIPILRLSETAEAVERQP